MVVSQCDMIENNVKKWKKNVTKKNSKSDAHSTVIYLYIPVITQIVHLGWGSFGLQLDKVFHELGRGTVDQSEQKSNSFRGFH